MKITVIKQQVKNPGRVSIFLDGKYSFSLTHDQLLDQALKKGLDIDEPELKRLIKLSDEGKIRTRALEWLMSRPHSEREFRDYMRRKKQEKDLTDSMAEDFKAKKYLNDYDFARWFTEQRVRKNKSSRAITSELFSKGVSGDIAREIVSEIAAGVDGDSLKALIEKMRRRTRYQDDKKLMTYLVGRGFNYSDIKIAIKPQQEL